MHFGRLVILEIGCNLETEFMTHEEMKHNEYFLNYQGNQIAMIDWREEIRRGRVPRSRQQRKRRRSQLTGGTEEMLMNDRETCTKTSAQ